MWISPREAPPTSQPAELDLQPTREPILNLLPHRIRLRSLRSLRNLRPLLSLPLLLRLLVHLQLHFLQ